MDQHAPNLPLDFVDLLAAFANAEARSCLAGVRRPRMGHPPVRVDLLKDAPGVNFADAWERRVVDVWNGVPAILISRDDLIHSKRASGREQDLIDARNLERAEPRQR